MCIRDRKRPFWGQKGPNMAGLPMPQSGLRGPKMIPNDQYNMYLIIWGHFGPILTLFGHFTQNLSFCSKSLWPRSTLCFLGKKSSFVWNDQKGSKWSQNGPKWSKTCYIDHLGSFWALLDRFGTSASLPCSAILAPIGPFWTPLRTWLKDGNGQNCFKPTWYMSKDYACATDPQSKHVYGRDNQSSDRKG